MYEQTWIDRTAELLDYIKSLGFKYSTTAGAMTVSVDDVKVPEEKKILAEAEKEVENIKTI
jgi:DNA-directed RNA polymerase subunit beta'